MLNRGGLIVPNSTLKFLPQLLDNGMLSAVHIHEQHISEIGVVPRFDVIIARSASVYLWGIFGTLTSEETLRNDMIFTQLVYLPTVYTYPLFLFSLRSSLFRHRGSLPLLSEIDPPILPDGLTLDKFFSI
jgi:hypothetical protein